ncbi:MAG: hypothetical protein RMI56_00840 [Sulfolobales archaeon]|nr:hypothetical protein [Sulfolobales archaeon]MDW8082326.1 hypothetical protein [Sulfolobales archaeon]
MKYTYLAYLILAVTVISVAVLPAHAQVRAGVIKLDISRTTVYRGYQWVEVVAYIYTGEATPAPTITRSVATLTAGITMSLPLSLIELYSPTTVTVGNVTYTIKYLALVRVFIPESAYTGKGTLRIEIAGRAAGVDFTFTRDITLEVADHRPVLAARIGVQAALERVRAIVTLASALGIDVTEYFRELSAVESSVAEATERLEVYGEVDEALLQYERATSSLASLEARVISSLAIRHGSLERRVTSLETSLTQTIKSVEDLSKTLAGTILALEKSVEEVSKRSMDAVSALAKQMEDYSKKVDRSLSALATSIDSALKSVAENTKKSTETALSDLAGGVKILDENVLKLAESQRDLASRVSDISNTLQISLIVVALMLLASIAVVRFFK